MNVKRIARDIGHDSVGHMGLAAMLHSDDQYTGCGRHSASLTAERPWAKPVGIPIFTGSAEPQQPSLSSAGSGLVSHEVPISAEQTPVSGRTSSTLSAAA